MELEHHSMVREPVHSTLVLEHSMVPERDSMDRNIDHGGST